MFRPARMRAIVRRSAMALVLSVAPAAAQNGLSFTESEGSAVRFGNADLEPQMACAAIIGTLSTPETTIVAAEPVTSADGVPAHCRVIGVIAPEIRFEVDLPATWNRRMYMIGNGGFAGETPEIGPRPEYRALALELGFAIVMTNTGHSAIGDPGATFGTSLQKRMDYGFRGVHRTIVEAKRIAASFYGRPPAFSYFDGCSNGGRQGLISAQRFPQDFDGILAGAPLVDYVNTFTQGLWLGRILQATPLTLGKVETVGKAVYARCDGKDGLVDGLIEDPRKCDFDPVRDVRRCAADNDGDDCLTEPQATVVAQVYNGMHDGGRKLHVGYSPGGEPAGLAFTGDDTAQSGWDRWLIVQPGEQSIMHEFGEAFVKYLAFAKADPEYDANAFVFHKDIPKLGDARRLYDATEPNLTSFRTSGGKLLMYFGWGDMALPPLMGIDYWEKARRANGPETADFFRLFMMPGMFHCRGGIGPDRFDGMTALINWVENGVAPDRITASRVVEGKVVRSRPLCPYPKVARYSGTGNVDSAASFSCQ